MQMQFEINYFETFLPPRCRKLRSRSASAMHTVELKELTLAEAPVAIIQSYPGRLLSWMVDGYGDRNRLGYHFHNGKLYAPCRRRTFTVAGGKAMNRWAKPSDINWDNSPANHAFEDGVAHLEAHFEKYRMIEGKVCKEIGEPCYVIMTFGLGGNHGIGWGTSLSTSNYYNSNISHERYFRIDQEKEAVEEGMRIALARGDTKAIPHFKKRLFDRFEIINPEAVKLNPSHEHGNGDEFTNRMNRITESAGDPVVAGFGILASIFS